MTVDSLGFLDAVGRLPEQVADAHSVAAAAVRPELLPDPGAITNVVVMGMGGSGISGDVVGAAYNNSLKVPFTTLKRYRSPTFVGPGTLAFAVSYSGGTEETLSMARGAAEQGAQVICVSVGGELAALAHERGAARALPRGVPAESGAGALVTPIVVTLFKLGMIDDAHRHLRELEPVLARRREECSPGVTGAGNPAREHARRIGRTVPLFYGGGALGAVAAYRWKCDVNENAKAPAFFAAYPELDHNEICAWGQHGDVTRQLITLVELRHGFEHEQLRRRFDVTRTIIEEAVVQVLSAQERGDSRLAQLLDLMYLGDWVSCYLALDNDVDPGPIDAISTLKDHVQPAGVNLPRTGPGRGTRIERGDP